MFTKTKACSKRSALFLSPRFADRDSWSSACPDGGATSPHSFTVNTQLAGATLLFTAQCPPLSLLEVGPPVNDRSPHSFCPSCSVLSQRPWLAFIPSVAVAAPHLTRTRRLLFIFMRCAALCLELVGRVWHFLIRASC